MNAKGKIQAQLSAYLDGELDEAQLRQVEEALESDGALRVELAQFAVARKLLRGLPAEKPPVDLVSRVLAEAERSLLVGGQNAQAGANPLRWVRYVASAAVLLMAATVGMVIAITLCSPGTYEDNLVRHQAPAEIRPDGKGNVADAGGGSMDEYALKGRGLSKGFDRDKDLGSRLGDGNVRSHNTVAFDSSGMAASNSSLPVISGKGGSGEGRNLTGGRAGGAGTLNNVDRMVAVLGGDLRNNEIIYTDRIDDAQKQVECILVANGIAPVVTEELERAAAKAKVAPEAPRDRGNFYFANRLSSAQVQYEAYVTPEQMEQVQNALGKLRAKQNVSQDAPAPALALAKVRGRATDGGWGYDKRLTGEGEKSLVNFTKTREKREKGYWREESQAPVTGVTARAAKAAPTLGAAQPPAPTPSETPTPKAEPVMPGKQAHPAPPMAAKASTAASDSAVTTKPAESAQVQKDAGTPARELAKGELAQRKTAATSPAAPAGKEDDATVATGTKTDLFSRFSRHPLWGTRGEPGSSEPSTRPAGQAAGPSGGQYAAGTPNVRVTAPASPPTTPAPAPDQEHKPVVQVTIINGAKIQDGKKITIELGRQSQSVAASRPTTRPAEGDLRVKGFAKANESRSQVRRGRFFLGLSEAPAGKAGQSAQPGKQAQFDGAYRNAPTTLAATARVQRLLITLNYRHGGEADKALNRAAAKIHTGPASRAAP